MEQAISPREHFDLDGHSEFTQPGISLLVDYSCPSNLYDEMFFNAGHLRPHWEYVVRSLDALGRDNFQFREQEVRRFLRDNGVTYNVYGDPQGQDRPWQLDLLPLLITSDEWLVIERGLIQRAELMSLLLADLYGRQDSLRKGILPVELVAIHPCFLRPLHGISISHRLPLYAVDLVRAPGGEFWAVADNAQALLGAGYALENRFAMSRVLPSLFRDSHVHRLSLFFRTLRSTLAGMSLRDDHRIVVLTSGPKDESYFEHAYLARYLGYTLVQGDDLTVRDGRVRLKTLDGLQGVDVILRGIDDILCDPLELHPDSYFGVAGLTQAVRMGNVALANPLGSGILENPGLMAFLPALAEYFLGEELRIPSPTTWWCGQPKARDYVLANLESLVIKKIGGHWGHFFQSGHLLSGKQRDLLRGQICAHPNWFIGIEEIFPSTTPIWLNGRLEPRQMTLRSFLVSAENDYRVMPGGLTRVAASSDNPLIYYKNGDLTKDTWVLASEPESQLTLVPQVKQRLFSFEGQRELPSRVAENLFWLGRYAERAEGTIRLLRTVLFNLLGPYDFSFQEVCLHSLLRAVTFLTETYPGFVGEGAEELLRVPEPELLSVFLDPNRVGSLSSTLHFLLYAAGSVRDRLSPDMWRVVSKIDEELRALQGQNSIQIDVVLGELDSLVDALMAFTGFGIECMTHEMGWHFLMIGRRLERAVQTSHLIRALFATASEDDAILLEYLLNITDSLLSYRRRYRSHLQLDATLELILLSESNPRAIAYQLVSLQRHISNLPGIAAPFRGAPERLILEALTLLRLAEVDILCQFSEVNFRGDLDGLLARLIELLPALSDAIGNNYFSHAEQPRQLVRMEGGDMDFVG
jgi:uncharacterized circularly permuted ATP-grasp superfamily protein/uncharacterized alpha-E superfamily protein